MPSENQRQHGDGRAAAVRIGARIFEEQLDEGFGYMELRRRMILVWDALEGEYIDDVWEGYKKRSAEVEVFGASRPTS
jgi:hypothetical protein